jgi:hypothetical protein
VVTLSSVIVQPGSALADLVRVDVRQAAVLAVAGLDDEARHDAVEQDVVVVAAAGQRGESAGGVGPEAWRRP